MLREGFRLLKKNLSHVIVFEIIYKAVSLAILIPLFYGLLNASVSAAGIPYLSTGTMNRYFRAPSTYLFLLLIVLAIAFYMLVNVSSLIYAFDCSYYEQKTVSLAMLFHGLTDGFRSLRLKNMGMFFYQLLAIPFYHALTVAGFVIGMKMPDFFHRFYKQHKLLLIILAVVFLLCCFLAVRRLLTLHCFVAHERTFLEARKESAELVCGKKLRILLGVCLINLVFLVGMVLLESVLATVIAKILSLIIAKKKLRFTINLIIRVILFVTYLILALVSTPCVTAYLSAWFYELRKETGYENEAERRKSIREKRKEAKENGKRYRNVVVSVTMVVTALLLNGYYLYLLYGNHTSFNIVYSNRASVTAHRGDSKHAPENTMAAIRLAYENQADIIEIDVRQTADGEYVVMHDESLARTTGVNKKVGECTLDYIKTLDAGSRFSEEYAGEPVPTLREVLTYAKENDIFLNIELKPAKTDHNYEEGILDLIREFEFEDQCVLASLDIKTVHRVQALDDEIDTVYIMSLAFGEIGGTEDVNAFSIRKSSISSRIVKSVHENHKEIYAWTVNNERDIKDVLLLDVDSVITDDPYKTKNIIYNANDSLLSDWMQRLVGGY